MISVYAKLHLMNCVKVKSDLSIVLSSNPTFCICALDRSAFIISIAEKSESPIVELDSFVFIIDAHDKFVFTSLVDTIDVPLNKE